MNPVDPNVYLSTDRTFDKYVISSSRTLTTVGSGVLPLNHSPTDGSRLGMLIEGEAENVFPDSEELDANVVYEGGMSRTAVALAGSTHSAHLAAGATGWVGANMASTPMEKVAVSVFITTGVVAPVIGFSDWAGINIAMRINGNEVNQFGLTKSVEGPMADGAYRLRIIVPVASGVLDSFRVGMVGAPEEVRVSRIQVEKDRWTSYIPTNGAAVVRAGETVSRVLAAGVNYNQDQGTLKVAFTPTPNSADSVITLRKEDWSAYLSIDHGDISEESIDSIRIAFSPYGIRMNLDGTARIFHLKSDEAVSLATSSSTFERIDMGRSYDGTTYGHFYGHIESFHLAARTWTDAELMA